MQIAPEIIFHDVDRSPWVENYVLERLARLEKFAEGITSCRVSLTQEQASHQKGNRYSVMVEVRLPPNHDLAAKKAKLIHDMQTQRSEEHTSELQSRLHLVCRLLLEKKNNYNSPTN